MYRQCWVCEYKTDTVCIDNVGSVNSYTDTVCIGNVGSVNTKLIQYVCIDNVGSVNSYTDTVCIGNVVSVNLYTDTVCIDNIGSEEHSGSVVVFDLISRGCRFEPHQRPCLVSLSKTLFPLLSTGSTQEDPSRHN